METFPLVPDASRFGMTHDSTLNQKATMTQKIYQHHLRLRTASCPEEMPIDKNQTSASSRRRRKGIPTPHHKICLLKNYTDHLTQDCGKRHDTSFVLSFLTERLHFLGPN